MITCSKLLPSPAKASSATSANAPWQRCKSRSPKQREEEQCSPLQLREHQKDVPDLALPQYAYQSMEDPIPWTSDSRADPYSSSDRCRSCNTLRSKPSQFPARCP